MRLHSTAGLRMRQFQKVNILGFDSYFTKQNCSQKRTTFSLPIIHYHSLSMLLLVALSYDPRILASWKLHIHLIWDACKCNTSVCISNHVKRGWTQEKLVRTKISEDSLFTVVHPLRSPRNKHFISSQIFRIYCSACLPPRPWQKLWKFQLEIHGTKIHVDNFHHFKFYNFLPFCEDTQ